MTFRKINILLADDDKDDCLFFKEALEELELTTQLTTVHNGEQLMLLLEKKSNEIFDVLFLDLNMPRKSGFECLNEIKRSEKLQLLPVVVLSTSCVNSIAERLYKYGVQHYFCKPSSYSELKKLIQNTLTLVAQINRAQPPIKTCLLKYK